MGNWSQSTTSYKLNGSCCKLSFTTNYETLNYISYNGRIISLIHKQIMASLHPVAEKLHELYHISIPQSSLG